MTSSRAEDRSAAVWIRGRFRPAALEVLEFALAGRAGGARGRARTGAEVEAAAGVAATFERADRGGLDIARGERAVAVLRALGDEEHPDLDVGKSGAALAVDRVLRLAGHLDDGGGPVAGGDRDGGSIDLGDLTARRREEDHDGVDRPRAVRLEGLLEADLVADLQIAERDRGAGLRVGRAAVDRDRAGPAVLGLERDVVAVDRGDGDLAEAWPEAAAALEAGPAVHQVDGAVGRAVRRVAGPGGEDAVRRGAGRQHHDHCREERRDGDAEQPDPGEQRLARQRRSARDGDLGPWRDIAGVWRLGWVDGLVHDVSDASSRLGRRLVSGPSTPRLTGC